MALYPIYPPCYQDVRQVGGLHRTCLVIELLTKDKLSTPSITILEDRICMMLQRDPGVDRAEVVDERVFTTELLQALRLKSTEPPQDSPPQDPFE